MKRTAGVATARGMIYGVLGWCAVALAIAGVMLPGLPTTIFVLAASYCFARSSPRFERWLRANPWLGPRLQRVAGGGGMPASAKRAALAAMWTAVLLSSALLVGIHWSAAAAIIGLGAMGTLAILLGVRTVERHAGAASLPHRNDDRTA
jgi:uncharacterized membrane protein YbaN (DUF454 family)